ncbi:unnamed protein product [Hydatigera taeniaeformis]|uniref:Chloride channel CLIC-like protein 1 n=1 Tax=Hydatigena taeniaeformis TaxID=6205 RepID=A0A0R3X7Y9_HYDTA|nr:unnamed protein product [Hydatigera taeniaeformis]
MFIVLRSGNWYSDLLVEDFEDLLPSEEMSENQNYVDNAAVEIAVDSDTSSDVVIVEELSQVSKNLIIDRVLRPRTSLNAFHLRCFSLPSVSTSKVHRSKKPSGGQCSSKKSSTSMLVPPVSRSLAIPSLFSNEEAPSTHDLIDFTANVGAALSASNKITPSPRLITKRRRRPTVFVRAHKRKHSTNASATNSVETVVRSVMQSSRAVFSRLQSKSNKLALDRSAEFLLKHPFLYPWERDEDRMNGGQWRERRAYYHMPLDRRLVWWTLAFFAVAASAETIGEDYVWMTDPQTHERYQVLRSSYDRDKAFFLGESTLSNRFSHAYLDALANQCNAVTGPPSVFEFLNHTLIAVAEFCFNPEIYPYSFEIYLRLFETIRWGPYTLAALVAVVFTFARFFCAKLFLKTKVGQRFTTEHSQKKAMTPLWNTISYTFLFSVEIGTLLNCGYDDFVYPLCIFKDIHFKRK